MSTEYDRVLVQPTPQQLAEALQQAVLAANERSRLRLLRWPPEDLDVALERLQRDAEGRLQWDGGGPAGDTHSAVAVAWWTDGIGRRHCRVVGRRARLDPAGLENLLSPGDDARPAVWLVYPDYFFRRHGRGRWELVALCGCGRSGAPAALGWMGDCCGACHDRREEGGTSAPAWPDPHRATLPRHHGHLLFLAWSPDGRTIATGGAPGVVQLWDVTEGRARATLAESEEGWLLAAAFAPEGNTMITGSNRGNIALWEAGTGVPRGSFPVGGPVMCLAVAPTGRLVAAADDRGATLWDLHTGELVHEWRGSLAEVSCLAFAPDGRTLACGSRQGTLKVWDVERGVERARLDRAGLGVAALAWAPDSQTLAVALHPPTRRHPGPEAGSVLLWGVARHRLRGQLSGHPTGTCCIAFAPDGRTLATGGNDRTLTLWDAASGQERVSLDWHLDRVCAVAFAPDGQTLATASFDGTAKLWPREVLSI